MELMSFQKEVSFKTISALENAAKYMHEIGLISKASSASSSWPFRSAQGESFQTASLSSAFLR